jgi:hypothetical protein
VTKYGPLCAWCGDIVPQTIGPGRPARYCRRSHRQRAYEARREAERRGIGPDEVLLTRHAWERLRDALYRLEAAAQDVALDVGSGRPTRADYADALGHLTAAVRDLQEVSVEPTAITD